MENLTLDRGDVWLLPEAHRSALGFVPNLRQEVYLYGEEEEEEEKVAVTEFYSIMGEPTVARTVATWSKGEKLRMEEADVWARRKDLGGKQVKLEGCAVGSVLDVKFNLVLAEERVGQECQGFLLRLRRRWGHRRHRRAFPRHPQGHAGERAEKSSPGPIPEFPNPFKSTLNFTVVNVPSSERGKFGSLNPKTGEWNGMVVPF